jgi:Rrf2 family protein
MRLSQGVEWSLHCCTLLAVIPPERGLTAAKLAEFHGVPPAYLAKHLQALTAVGILEAVPGRRGGYRLAKRIEDITLLDVVDAIEGDDSAFRCTEIRQRGPSALDASRYALPCGVARAMRAAEEAWRAELARRTIADLVFGLLKDVPTEAATKAAAWVQEVAR